MEKGRCRKAFEQMQEKRLSYPLKAGIYKIREVRRDIKSWNNQIDILAKNRRKKDANPMMRHCTIEDSYRWLKKLPLTIAGAIGYKTLPGLQALHGDDIPEETINMLKAKYTPQLDNLIDKCDILELRLRKNIGLEYHKWEYGESDLKDLLNGALSIIDGILNYAMPA